MKLNRVKYNNSLQLLFYFFSIFVLFLTENKREFSSKPHELGSLQNRNPIWKTLVQKALFLPFQPPPKSQARTEGKYNPSCACHQHLQCLLLRSPSRVLWLSTDLLPRRLVRGDRQGWCAHDIVKKTELSKMGSQDGLCFRLMAVSVE